MKLFACRLCRISTRRRLPTDWMRCCLFIAVGTWLASLGSASEFVDSGHLVWTTIGVTSRSKFQLVQFFKRIDFFFSQVEFDIWHFNNGVDHPPLWLFCFWPKGYPSHYRDCAIRLSFVFSFLPLTLFFVSSSPVWHQKTFKLFQVLWVRHLRRHISVHQRHHFQLELLRGNWICEYLLFLVKWKTKMSLFYWEEKGRQL